MMFQFYFKQMGSSDTLRDLSEKKLSDIVERFAGSNGLVRITFQTGKNAQRMDCHLLSHTGRSYQASATGSNMYANLDAVAQKLEAQLLRSKTRSDSRMTRRTNARLHLVPEDSAPIWDSGEDDYDDGESKLLQVH